MKNPFKYLLLALLIPLFSFTMHKYYISLTQIELKDKNLQIQMRVFLDDFEKELNNTFQKDFQLTTKYEIKNVDSFFYKHLQNKFQITINDSIQHYQFIGKEYESDAINFYLEIENPSRIQSILIRNNLLTETFENQENIIKLKINNTNKTFILTAKNDKGLLKF